MRYSHFVQKLLRNQKERIAAHWFAPALLSTLTFMTGCGASLNPQQPGYHYALTLKVSPADSIAALESKYEGTVQVFHPEVGFAVLGVNKKPEQDANVLGFELNASSVEFPESKVKIDLRTMEGSAWSTWGSSWSTWGSSWSTWGSSWSTWGSSSSSTSLPATPPENRFIWSMTRMTAAQAVSKNYGVGAKIAVIDSGIDLTHTAFTGRLAPAAEWKDFVDGDATPQEVSGGNGYGHGTFISSVILQVAPRATILPIRVLAPDGSGSETAVVSAIDWAIQKGAQIINLSLGATTDNAALKAQIDYATSRGVYVVVAAGNNSSNTLNYPAQWATTAPNEKYLISVGSTASTSLLSSFCNVSPALEIVAPGELVYGALPGSKVGYASGTSFATPQVAGSLALLMMDTAAANRGNLQKYLLDSAAQYPGGYRQVDMAFAMRQAPDYVFKNALMVVGSSTLNTGDYAVKSKLERLGYSVTIKTGPAAVTADATAKDLVLISSTVTAADVNTKFRNVTAPVIVWESALYDDLGMVDLQANTGSYATENKMDVINTHPIAAGLSNGGTYNAYTSSDMVSYGIPAASAIKVATLDSNPNLSVIFAYDKSAQMVGLTAPGRRIGIMLGDAGAGKIDWAGEFMFNAAVTWAVSGN